MIVARLADGSVERRTLEAGDTLDLPDGLGRRTPVFFVSALETEVAETTVALWHTDTTDGRAPGIGRRFRP